jgi:hypothetical protein
LGSAPGLFAMSPPNSRMVQVAIRRF